MCEDNCQNRKIHQQQQLTNSSHLLQPSISGAEEDHVVSVVDVGGDRGQPVPALGEHRPTRHQLGPPQRLVDIQATEVVIDGHRLQGDRERWRGRL